MNEEKYKIITINHLVNNKIINELDRLFSRYPTEDIYYKIENANTIKIYLNQLDFSDFKNTTTLRIHFIDDNTKLLLKKILTKIESIKSYGLKGRKRVYVGYDQERKVRNRKLKEVIRKKYYYAQDHNFSKKNNEVPKEFINKIIVGDSEEVLKKLPDNCIDLIFTSPPYNFGLDYENHKDGINWNEYFNKLFRIFKECIRVLKYGARIIVNVQPLFSDYIPIHHIISNFFMENKLIWKGEILWEKHNYNCKYTAWGSWKSPSNPYLKYTWEFLEIFSKGTLKHYGKQENADITADEFKKWVYAKWDIAPEYNMKKYGHPAMFPEELAERVIKLFSFRGDVVLDPFNGAGTTCVVAKRLGRKYIGIDISEEYCKKAEERLRSVLIQLPLFDKGGKKYE
ncbi:DNA-methyltransferase [Thermodesulforhabdus norvegica]|uniref:Methyltransferase n=1 Tax=Thermodesulforhabdus norvegica TaxID=39841 RepID=A0A1I4VWA8_9BACT|nr:site-specific DNA-methyltransferase [Thermodesulforhabdus norvegica]SFN05296.1 DNA modification methylase [Thermodesulforhabdus norvegica]